MLYQIVMPNRQIMNATKFYQQDTVLDTIVQVVAIFAETKTVSFLKTFVVILALVRKLVILVCKQLSALAVMDI